MKKFLPIITFLFLSIFMVLFGYYAMSSGQRLLNGFFAFADTPQLTLYADNLESGFTDWSWGGERNFQDTEFIHNGNHSLKFTPTSWSGLYLHTENRIDSHQYESLVISVRGSTDNQKLSVVLYDENNQMIGSFQPLENFGGSVPNGSWKTYTIPLQSLNPTLTAIKGFAIQEATGQTQAAIYFDDIFLKSKIVPTATPEPAPTAQPTEMLKINDGQATAESIIKNSLPLYTDSLKEGLKNWSWSSSVNFEHSGTKFEGSHAISFTPHAGWAGLYLHTDQAIDTTAYDSIDMVLKASSPDQKFSLALHDNRNELMGKPIPLDTYGPIPTGTWKRYSIPLAQLGAENKQLTGIMVQETSGHSQPALFLDNISLTSHNVVTAPESQTNTSKSVDSSKTSGSNMLSGQSLYVKTYNSAQQTVDSWRATGRNSDADQLMKIATQPTASWVVGGDPYQLVQDTVSKAEASGSIPVIVAYNIPGRDCGHYSQGGTNAEDYKAWITKFGDAIGQRKAAVVLEPDALGLDCLQNDTTYSLLRYAVDTLTSHPGVAVYIEASTWVKPDTMADRLNKAGIQKAQGFALNTSGYNTTESMITYGSTVSGGVNGKHFVIDTSRNGSGPYDSSQPEPWCNPPGRSLGRKPTTQTGNPLVDAYLWVKVPGESDGTCRGGPSAGVWWPEYALGLAQRSS